VVVIPTHKPNQRKQLPSRYFANRASKFAAIIDEIARIHATGQPILVGTRTIEISEVLAEKMRAKKLPFRLLNGKQDEEEAQIVSRAGELRAITIATNMAGRGTDIKLGPKVSQSGGLHVIATERHESARVDRQLIGRVARQGDPGSCQYFVSAEDHLITLYAPALSKRMQRASRENGEVDVDFSGELAKVQLKVERLNFAQRQQMFAHDHWLDGVLSTLAEE
jgi:preprotein translocase subunit SecA